MRRALVAAAVLALAGATPNAHAAPVGAGTTCGLLAVSRPPVTGARDAYAGLVFGAAAAGDTATLPALPSVTVRCALTVNGNAVPSAGGSNSGPGAAVVLDDATFEASDGADVEMCTTIVVDGNVEHAACVDATFAEVPPAELCDLLLGLCDDVGQALFLYVIPQPVVL